MDGTMVYVVTRIGVYMQGIVGVASSLEDAERLASEALAHERDTYHDMLITPRKIGDLYVPEYGNLDYPWSEEAFYDLTETKWPKGPDRIRIDPERPAGDHG